MSKFLRKYQTLILVIGGSLLMIAFLIPTAVGQRGSHDATGEVRYTLTSGRKVTVGEMQRTSAIVQTAARFIPGWMTVYGLGEREGLQWFMLAEMAREQGLLGPKGEGSDAAFIQQMVLEDMQVRLRDQYGDNWQMELQFRPELAERLQEDMKARVQMLSSPHGIGSAGMSVSTDDLLAQARGIRRLREYYAGLMRVSPARLMSDARRQYTSASVQYLLVPIDERTLAGLPAPSEAEIAAHYEAFKNVPAGTGQHGLGYTMPARTKLTWLTLSHADVAAAVVPDPEEVTKRMKAEATLPNEDKDAKLTRVVGIVRDEVATKAVAAAAEVVRNEVLLVTSKLPQAPGKGTRLLPEGGAGVDLEALGTRAAERASAVVGRTVAPFKVTVQEKWVTDQQALELPGIGQAMMRVGSGQMSAVGLAFSVAELSPANPPPTPVQVGLPIASAMEDQGKNQYFMVVTAARPSGPPLNLEEVKDEITLDLRKIAALKKLEEQMPGWTARAREISLDDVRTALAASNPEVPEVRRGARVSREVGVQPAEPGVNDPAVVEAVLERAEALDPRQAIDPRDPSLTLAVSLPKRFAIVIAQVTEYRPLTIEDYRRLAGQARDSLIVREMSGHLNAPFSLAALGKRFGIDVGKHDEKN